MAPRSQPNSKKSDTTTPSNTNINRLNPVQEQELNNRLGQLRAQHLNNTQHNPPNQPNTSAGQGRG